RDRAPATPTELVHATDAYVGPAREPAVPHRAPGWLRGAMTPMQVPDFATGLPPALARMPVRPGPPDLPVPPALAPTAPPSPAEPVRARPVGPIRSVAPAAPPALAGPPAPPAMPAPPARRNLGQSRRFGLGAPTSRPASEPFQPPGTPEPEPTPSPRAPEAAPSVPAPAAAVPARTEPVPPSLVHDLRAAHGVDLSDVPVRRGPDVDGTAEQLGA